MYQLSDAIERKFIESIDLNDIDLDIEIESDKGWVSIDQFNLTIPYNVWRVELEDGSFIECADTHILFEQGFEEVYVKDLSINDSIITKTGLKKVIAVFNTGCEPESMFDISVDSDEHRFYNSNGILNHNSTTVSGFIIWSMLFTPSYAIGLMANKMENAQELLGRVRLAYENLPKWIQQGIVTWNLRSIALENNSSVFASATTVGGLRSKSLNMVVLDEFAHVPYNIQTKFFTSTYPVITSGTKTKIVIISTPNGMELFFNLWKAAVGKKNSYKPINIHWSETPGRDEKWKEETIKNTSKEQFRQEYDTEFIGSSDTLIDPIVLARLEHIDTLRESEEIAIYKEPIPNHTYMLVADTARGVGGDYSAFLVLDVSYPPYEVVAQFRQNTIKPETYPNYIAHAASVYNNAYILAEDNDVGAQIISILLYDLECDNIMQTGTAGRAGTMLNDGKNIKFGIKTTTSVKRIGCFALKSIIENDQVVLNSEELVSELISFIKAGKSFEAQEGRHDDLVMCLVLFAWATTQTAFRDITETADSAWQKIQEQKRQKHEEDQLLFGIVDEGEIEETVPIDFTPALSDVIEQAQFEVGNW